MPGKNFTPHLMPTSTDRSVTRMSVQRFAPVRSLRPWRPMACLKTIDQHNWTMETGTQGETEPSRGILSLLFLTTPGISPWPKPAVWLDLGISKLYG